jgi:hypothetical protein
MVGPIRREVDDTLRLTGETIRIDREPIVNYLLPIVKMQ